MTDDISSDSGASELTAGDRISVLFLGSGLHYSPETLNSVEFEFGVSAQRCDSIDTALEAPAIDLSTLRLLVVDQRLADDLLTRPSTYRRAAGDGDIAFAYRDDAAARMLRMQWNRDAQGDIGFLPANVPVEVWRATLQLLLHHQLYVPVALMDDEEQDDPARPAAPDTDIAADEGEIIPCAVPQRTVFGRLTRREKEVLSLVAQGDSNKAVASQLGITEHTVKLHMHNLVNKIGVPNRTAAASFYFEVAGQAGKKR